MNRIEHTDINDIANEHLNLVCPLLARPENLPTRKRIYYANSVYERIFKKMVEYNGKSAYNLFAFFEKEYIKIIIGEIDELEKVAYFVKRIIKKNKLKLKAIDPADGNLKKTKLFKDIIYCFNYDSYRENEFPYKILSRLNINACPYCNRQFINTFYSKDGKTRATLDHFYSQSKYPFLSISFYNLIPSCYPCNSSLKGSKNFTNQTHLNPFKGSFDNLVSFTIKFEEVKDAHKYIAEFYNNPEFMKIDFKYLVKEVMPELIKAKRNIDDLKLVDLYNLHKDFIVELLQKEVIYDKGGYANLLAKSYPKLFSDEHDVLRLLLGNYYNPKDFNKRPFSRIIHDISDELGLTKRIIA